MDTIGEEERRTRVMELAQQQMEALQRLDEVVENQRNLLERTRNGRRLQEERDEEEEEDEMVHPDDGNDVPQPEQDEPRLQRAPNDNALRMERRDHRSCPITHMYLLISALLAFLAVATSPSNVLFASFRVTGTRPTAQKDGGLGDANEVPEVDASKHELPSNLKKGSVTVDGYGNFVDRVFRKGEWDAVVAHSKAKQPPPSETQKEKAGAADLPSTSNPSSWTSWTDSMANYVQEVNEHFIENYSVFRKLKFQANPQQPIAEDAVEQPNSSQRWLPPWEWKNQKHTKESRKTDDSPKQSRAKKETNSFANVKLHSHLTPLLRVISPSSFWSSPSTNNGGATGTQASTNYTNGMGSGAFLTAIDTIFTSTPRLIAVANLLLAVTYLVQTAIADLFLGPVNVTTVMGGNPNNPTGAAANNLLAHDPATRRRRAGRERLGGFLLFKLLLISAVLEPDSIDLFILLSWYTLLSFLRSLAHLAGTTTRHVAQSGETPSPGALRLLTLVLVCDAFAAIGCITVFSSLGVSMLLLLTCDCILLGIDAVVHILRHFGATMEEAYRLEVTQLEEHQADLRGESDDSSVEGSVQVCEAEIIALEAAHSRCMATMERSVFSLEMVVLIVTIAHFIHIWALHGTGFGLVDGVLALHLHSTIALMGKKISDRRNAHRIARELNKTFADASELDIRKASAAGDVCCICLNSLRVGKAKKAPCEHLFHTYCLREVVERERSISLAKCPLCRAPLVAGRHVSDGLIHPEDAGAVGIGAGGGQVQPAQPPNQQLNPGEQTLLRFSTDSFLPAWLPIPAFAFEVVRRETPAAAEPNPNPDGGWQRFFRRGGDVQVMAVNDNGGNNEENNEQQPPERQPQQRETSFWRRLFILLGAIPMSPEEEAAALEQLVEMFPQYDRADLLRELRSRRSAEAVAEAIILGIFSGIPRGNVD